MHPCENKRPRLRRKLAFLFLFSVTCATLAASTASAWELKAHAFHTCVIDDIGVACWGAGEANETGGNNFGQSIVPTDLANPRALALGSAHTCALDDSGVRCWGAGGPGQTGGVHSGQSTVPSGLVNPRAIAAGGYHTCVLDDSTKGVTCWGRNTDGQITVPSGLVNPRAIAAGEYHTCVIDDIGVACWGAGEALESGSNDKGQSIVPAGLVNPTEIAGGFYYTCVVDGSTNGVTCWGDRTYVPGGMVQPVAIATGLDHSCALANSEWSICWGNNTYGQAPSAVHWTNPTLIAAGFWHTCVLDDNGVSCGGDNSEGQISVPSGLVFVPEPELALLQASAMLCLGLIARRRRRKQRTEL